MSEADIGEMRNFSPADAKTRRQLMLQALLAERFKLKVHSETKPGPVYELVVAKGGPKMKDAATDTSDELRKDKDGKPRSGIFVLNDTSLVQGEAMTQFALVLSAPL